MVLLTGACLTVTFTGRALAQPSATLRKVEPIPARYVRLEPSPFADAMAANRRYLLSLDPERLLHNFYWSAGLEAKKPRYGGWESESIAGHSLGHWLSACSLVVANTGDPAIAAVLDHTLAEMARIQAAEGDGYLGGTTAERGGKEVPGKVIFEEVRRGQIEVTWTLNGGWVPIYTYHKVLAGVIDAHLLAGNERALPIALGLAGYLAGVLAPLSDEQVQTVLSVEHGGILESYAELYAITGDARWLQTAERLRHRAFVDPLLAGRDALAGLHANTQIPKAVGLARFYEMSGRTDHGEAAAFFHKTVVDHHSYVLGGNSEREHFGPPDQLGGTLTTGTCEACNTYNMLKLTRHLYAWSPDGALFDYYERAQLNHILAHQRPDTGQFVYFMPLQAGAKRDYSTPENSFWCCVGSGMESHAKHADSIYWRGADALYVNLFTPSTLDVPNDVKLELSTRYPEQGEVTLRVARPSPSVATLAVRRPGWAQDARIAVNGRVLSAPVQNGYWRVTRAWRAGDTLTVTLPMALRAEPLKGAPDIYAFLSGPLVLAADLGPASQAFDGPAPALLVRSGPTSALASGSGAHRYATVDVLGQRQDLRPFNALYDRRTAVYFQTFTPTAWKAERQDYLASEARRADLARRTIDTFYIGEMQPERDHGLTATAGQPGTFYGRHSRSIPEGAEVSFTMARRPGAAFLRATYWGNDVDREMLIEFDGRQIVVERRPGPSVNDWVTVDYPLPPSDQKRSKVRLIGRRNTSVIYGLALIETPRADA
ncbi:MAG: glycoside hydrolase family 127 protein [Caulobacter sp.]|nr:glycoside hydrolase family 127 protein [Caulobacter sp.]